MKKNNKEKINLIITEPGQKEPESFNPSSYYQEIMDIDEKNEDDIISYDEKKDYINLFLESFVNKIEEVLRSFYFMELFYISINKDNKSSLIRDDLKQRVKKITLFIEDIQSKFFDNISINELNQLYLLTNKYIDYFRETKEMVIFLKENYFKNIKTISYAAFANKKSFELESLCKETEQKIKEFKSIYEIYDYCSYYSGDLIVETVNALVECFKKSNNREYIKTYNFNYFLESDVIMQFDFLKWVNLFNKIKYVMKTTSNVEMFDYLKFDTLFRKLEKRYLLVLIYNETENNRRGNN